MQEGKSPVIALPVAVLVLLYLEYAVFQGKICQKKNCRQAERFPRENRKALFTIGGHLLYGYSLKRPVNFVAQFMVRKGGKKPNVDISSFLWYLLNIQNLMECVDNKKTMKFILPHFKICQIPRGSGGLGLLPKYLYGSIYSCQECIRFLLGNLRRLITMAPPPPYILIYLI